MARSNRQSRPSIKDILIKEPYRFEFHQAVKLLEYLHPNAAPFGETVRLDREVAHIKSRVFFESISSDIYSLEDAVEQTPGTHKPPILNVNFMGIAGIQGPLPYPYAEMIIQRIRHEDPSLKDFLDIFNHRLISILHRTRKQYLISLNTKSPEKTDIANAMISFLGVGQKALRERLHVTDRSLLKYAGLVWTTPHSGGGLEKIISGFFKISTRIEYCKGIWREIPKNQRSYIGQYGQWQVLGEGAVLGTRTWDQQGHFHFHLLNLNAKQLDSFLPYGKNYKRLTDMIRFYAGPLLNYTLIYSPSHPPSTRLGRKSHLGWRTWLGKSLKEGDNVHIESPQSFQKKQYSQSMIMMY